MATYAQLRGLFSDDVLRNRVTTATIVAANNLLKAPTPTTADRAWADRVIKAPDTVGREVFLLVLAANKDAATTAIQNATDTDIQTAVDGVIPQLVMAHSGS